MKELERRQKMKEGSKGRGEERDGVRNTYVSEKRQGRGGGIKRVKQAEEERQKGRRMGSKRGAIRG